MRGENLNFFQITDRIVQWLPEVLGPQSVRHRLLDFTLAFGVPFNRWLGLKIKELTPSHVVVESPPRLLRRNHVGTAHACALALMGEYTSGLVLAQRYPIDSYRIIIAKLEIEYHRSGRGTLTATSKAPESWPEMNEGQSWISMETTIIRGEDQEPVATCRTQWQIKPWERVRGRTGGERAKSRHPLIRVFG